MWAADPKAYAALQEPIQLAVEVSSSNWRDDYLYRAHLRTFGDYAKIEETSPPSDYGLFKQSERCGVGNP
ncbi:MAG: hypothetical protein RLZZ597_1230 [Cyanobacteriota bacterium]